ncbi:MAG: hypothetical protein ACRD3W_26175 [Terriglobales bacterium]
MAHFNSEGLVTRLEVESDTAAPLGANPLKAERAKRLSTMVLGDERGEPKRSETPEPSAILELVDVAPTPTDCAMPDPLIQGLMGRLPKPDSVWSLDDRGNWLRAAAVIFSLVYKTDKGGPDWHSSVPKALP